MPLNLEIVDAKTTYGTILPWEVRVRMSVERHVIKHLAETLIDAGFDITVHDGEENVLNSSISIPDILNAIMSVDEEHLKVRDANGTYIGSVFLVYGNDGWDVISDYSTSLEKWLDPVNKWIDEEFLV